MVDEKLNAIDNWDPASPIESRGHYREERQFCNCPPGRRGWQGQMGPNGLKGSDGPDGSPGGIGPPGNQGPPGSPGANGITGTNGRTGSMGPTGLPGAPGKDGNPGKAGVAGLAGSPGSLGVPGAYGISGPVGVPGAHGETGSPGNPGKLGTNGPNGPVGLSGAVGADGVVGPPGSPGPMGPFGPMGVIGAAGTNDQVLPRPPIPLLNCTGSINVPSSLFDPCVRLQTPNFPENYENFYFCQFFVQTPTSKGLTVTIKQEDFRVETIFDDLVFSPLPSSLGDSGSLTLRGILSQDFIESYAPREAFTLTFVTDGSVTFKGFKLKLCVT
ncbi:collagen alpha-1(X) chain-like isoform X2 [Tigriopus californicus]|nr:collagen alpha-1(X) chain-like isoform X2 [Tigriopus californicus]XP_059097727.1 collagen alpha-1(X) chain-like isoform X2 [Tigriopus californicus]